MSMDRLLRDVVATGKWAQCLYCRRAQPHRWHRDAQTWLGHKDHPVIEANGYCTDCQRFAPKEPLK